MNKFLNKAHVLTKYFGVYGYGNFDVTHAEIAEILSLLDEKNSEEKLKSLYARLEKERMG